MPTVSAIITTYNRAPLVRRAIQSVLAQDYGDFELLVLDNSSGDGTDGVVGSFSDRRIRYFRHPPMDIGAQRNLGVREARGTLLAFLDDDDEWTPGKLSHQIAVFAQRDSETAVVYGGFVHVDSEGGVLKTHRPALRGRILRELLRQEDDFTGAASNPLIRKSAVEAVGGYAEWARTGEDWELYLRLAESFLIDFTPEVVVRIHQHHGARLGDRLRDAADLEMHIMRRFRAVFEADPPLRSRYLQKIGGKLIRVGDRRAGRKYVLQAIGAAPLSPSAYAQLAASFMGERAYRLAHGMYLDRLRRPA